MNNNPLISIIVPVYNVQPYLRRCLNSLTEQTYDNLELILVDDCSTDESGKICDEYCQIDTRVQVLHAAHGGASVARNLGIALARGEYVGFVDSDDWVEPDMFAYLLALIQDSNSDVALIELRDVYEKAPELVQPKEVLQIYKGEDMLIHFLQHNCYSACIRLHHRSHFAGFAFDQGRINEDVVGGYQLLSAARQLITSNQIKYNYYQNMTGVTNSALRKKDFDLFYSGQRLLELAASAKSGELRQLALTKQKRAAFTLLVKMALYGTSPELEERRCARELLAMLRPDYLFLMRSGMPFNRKLLLTIVCLSYPLCKFLARAWQHLHGNVTRGI